MIDRKQLKSKIPHGELKKMAENINVSPVSVSNYFSGRINSERIELAALRLAAKIANQKKQLLKQIND